MHQTRNTSSCGFLRCRARRNSAGTSRQTWPEVRLSSLCKLILPVASATVVVRLTWAEGAARGGLTGVGVTFRQVRLVCAETPGAVGLASTVGEHHSEVRNHQGTDRWNGGKPPSARSVHHDGQDET